MHTLRLDSSRAPALIFKCRHTRLEAGIQSQGCEASAHSSACTATKLPSMALDSGIQPE